MNRRSPRAPLCLAAALLALGGLSFQGSGCSNSATGGAGGTTGGAGTSATGAAGTGAAGTGAAGTAAAAGTTGGVAGTTAAAGMNGTAGTTAAGGTTGSDAGAGSTGSAGTTADAGADKPATDGGAMTLTTTSLKMTDGGLVFPPASSAPMNQSPALMWSGAPAGTLSFALSMRDLSAMNTHFVLYDITPATMMLMASLPRGAMPAAPAPAGSIWKSAFGAPMPGYEGPGGGGVNNYEIQIWALKVAKLQVGNMELNAIYTTLLPSQKLDSAKIFAKGTRNGL